MSGRSLLATLLAFVMILTTATPTSAAVTARQTKRIGKWHVETYVETDGTRVERAWLGDVFMESRIVGSTVTTEIRTPDVVQIVVSDRNSPTYTVTTNGETKEYTKPGWEERQALPSPKDGQSEMAGTEGVSIQDARDLLGEPYFGRFLASKAVYSPIYVAGSLYENYDWELVEYDPWWFTAYTTVSTIIGILGISTEGFLKIAGSVCAVIGGVLMITDAITVEINSYGRFWFKYVEIAQDPNGGIWYNASREQYLEIFESRDGLYVEVLSDRADSDFYNNSALLDRGIENYLIHRCGWMYEYCT